MMDRQQRLIVFIVSLVLVIGVIAGVNYYYFKPKVLLTMPSVERVKVPEKIKIPFKSNIYAETMEQILAEKKEEPLPLGMGLVKRNPFIWPEETIKQTEPRKQITQNGVPIIISGNTDNKFPEMVFAPETEAVQEFEEIEFNLSMVIVGETRNLALLNNRFVTEGSKIAGYDVVKIEPGTIFLAGKDDKKMLTLEPGGPLESRKASSSVLKKKDTPKKEAPGYRQSTSPPLDFQTQLKQVMELYSNPNLLLK